jgi:hypothetical protein
MDSQQVVMIKLSARVMAVESLLADLLTESFSLRPDPQAAAREWQRLAIKDAARMTFPSVDPATSDMYAAEFAEVISAFTGKIVDRLK